MIQIRLKKTEKVKNRPKCTHKWLIVQNSLKKFKNGPKCTKKWPILITKLKEESTSRPTRCGPFLETETKNGQKSHINPEILDIKKKKS